MRHARQDDAIKKIGNNVGEVIYSIMYQTKLSRNRDIESVATSVRAHIRLFIYGDR